MGISDREDERQRQKFGETLKALSDLNSAEFANGMKVLATLVRIYFQAMLEAGFTEDQAMTLTLVWQEKALKGFR